MSEPADRQRGSRPKRPFLGVHFIECGAYGRFYRNREGNAYLGSCPRCGRSYRVAIGANGTASRFFQAHCNH